MYRSIPAPAPCVGRVPSCPVGGTPSTTLALFLLLLLLPLLPTSTLAAWPDTGLPVCDAPYDQFQIVGCEDGSGGMLLAWKDQRILDHGIYVQRVDVQGTTLWAEDGVHLSTPFHSAWNPAIAPDGAGGAWVAWEDRDNPYGDVYLQHVDANGSAQLEAGGRPIRVGSGFFSPRRPVCAADGSGGVIAAFVEELGPTDAQVVAQRFDASAVPQWSGAAVVVGASIEVGGRLDVDTHHPLGSGIVLGWVSGAGHAVMQWLDVDGTSRWNGTSGHAITLVVPDTRVRVARRERATGGAYLLYQTSTSFGSITTYWWNVKGIEDNQYMRVEEPLGGARNMLADATVDRAWDGGVVAGWSSIDPVSGDMLIEGIQLEADGDVVWSQVLGIDPPVGGGSPPVVLYTNAYFGYRFVWPTLEGGEPVLAFRTQGRDQGVVLPDPGSAPLSGTSSSVPPVLVAHGELSDRVFVAWRDERTGTQTDVYANLFEPNGSVPRANLAVESLRATPNPNEVGDPTHWRVVVRNRTTFEAGAFDVGFWRDAAEPLGEPDRRLPVAAGLVWPDSVVIEFDDTVTAPQPESWSARACADVDDVVDETDETDNCRDAELVWVARPDLVVEAFTVAPVAPEVGEFLQYTVTVANEGNVSSAPCEVRLYHDRTTAPGVGDPGDDAFPVPTLLPGASTLVHRPGPTSTELGRWRSWAYVDATDVVDEADETNNRSSALTIEWGAPLDPGWPVDAGSGALHAPLIASLPTVPRGLRAVVVTSTDGRAHAWDGQGDVLEGWPFDAGASILTPATAGDLDGDGVPEVLFGTDDARVVCLDADGTERWSYPAGADVVATVVVFDLLSTPTDEREVVVADVRGRVHLLDPRGQLLPGWPVPVGDAVGASPAVGDLNGDGIAEIVAVGTQKSGDAVVHVLRPDGSAVGGRWPLAVGAPVVGSPALGDVCGDSDLEIVVADTNGVLHGWVIDGASPDLSVALGLPVRTAVALARHDPRDAKLSVYAVAEAWVNTPPIGGHWQGVGFACDGAGAMHTGWPVPLSWGSADCRAGGGPIVWHESKELRVAFGSEPGQVFAFDAGGTRLDGYRMSVPGAIAAALAAADIDGDRHLEVVLAGGGEVRAYDLLAGSYAPQALDWAQEGHDPQRTRCWGAARVTAVDGDDRPVRPIAHSRLLSPRPNPFNPRVILAYEIAREGSVTLRVHDLAGRHVAHLFRGTRAVGLHEQTWDGRDTHGRRVASGVYLVELRAPDGRDVRRVVLIE